MFPSLLRRIALVATVATASTALVAGATTGSAGAVTGAGPHSTSLSIRAAHAAVKPGGSDTVTGNLRVGSGQALPGKTLTLEARMAGDPAFLPVGTAVTGPYGGVALAVTPAETTRYRWTFAGDDADRASHSGVVSIAVRVPAHRPRRLPSSLSVRVLHPQVTVEGTDTVTGRLVSRRFALRNKVVLLLSRADGAADWSFARAQRTGAGGRVSFVVKPSVATRYRLAFQGTANFRKARSGVVHVAVRSTALTVALSTGHVAPGGAASLTGVLTNHAAAYAGQSVQLWGKPLGTNQRFAALSSTVTGADGSVAFTVSPARSMRYFLYFPGATGAPAAKSATRTLAVS